MTKEMLDKYVEEDFEYFKKCVERGIKKLVGEKTEEKVRNCFHCKLWSKANKFINEIEDLK